MEIVIYTFHRWQFKNALTCQIDTLIIICDVTLNLLLNIQIISHEKCLEKH